MNTFWYVIKVLPGKERQLNEQYNMQISLGNIKNIKRFICPTETEFVVVKDKKVLREKVIYSGYLYFEADKEMNEDQLKEISSIPNIMGMMGDKKPLLMRKNDVEKIIKDELLIEHKNNKKSKFDVGTTVTISDGPFSGFIGVVSSVEDEKVNVDVKIFGRTTPVSLSINQIKNQY
jgi:transcriptional antiterminator NusG